MKTLIIDRVKVFQQLIAGILNDSSIEYVFGATGKEAIELLQKEQFDCICLSLYLDDTDGMSLCEQIRKMPSYRHTPVVLLTSETGHDLTRQALRSGVTDIFSKSKVDELVNFIERFTRVNKPFAGKILYIEDQRSQRELVTRMFQNRQLEVDSFETAEDAWKAYLKHSYQLVVTDIVLAGEVSGVLLINKIRRLHGPKGDVPILAITAFDDTSRRISLYHMGITDYVTKPIIEEELIARVRNLIHNQRALEREQQFRQHLTTEEVVRRSMKMEAMGKLTGGVAHDYNNTLSVIMGYTELLKRQLGQGQEKLLGYVEQIEKASQSGAKLTGKLLAFTRKKPSKTEVINLNQMVVDIEPMLNKLLTESIIIKHNLDDELWNIRIDNNDLESAILNLAINARYAMGEKGSFTLITSNKHLAGDVADRLGLIAGDYVRLSVLDSGCGMDADTAERIFDPFFSTKGEEGTGLGLSQVYGFMQRSNGAINVESKLGKGTLFNLYFPRSDEEPEKPENNTVESDQLEAGKQARVLVVDDEVALANLNAEILEAAGYQTHVANSAEQAISLCHEQTFDLVLTDIIMPGMNGYELAEKVIEILPEVKIITLSGYDESVKATQNQLSLIALKLEKPANNRKLLEAVRKVCHSGKN